MATTNIFDMTDTWNAGGTTFTAIKMNVTDTASAALSLLMDLQVGGSSLFNVGKSGQLILNKSGEALTLTAGNAYLANGVKIATTGYFQWDAQAWLYSDAANVVAQRNSTNAQTFRVYETYIDGSNYERASLSCSSNTVTLAAETAGTGADNMDVVLTSAGSGAVRTSGNIVAGNNVVATGGFYPGAGADTGIVRDAANVLAQVNGTNAQAFRLYNTWTDGSNFERGYVRWSSNVFEIGADEAGTGSARIVRINSNSAIIFSPSGAANAWTLENTGRLYPGTDNAYDFGAQSNRLRSLYVGGGVVAGTVTKTANYTATANDFTIRCDATSGAVTITLPAAASHTGRLYRIKKVDASANAVTIDGNGAETIDGAATQATTTQYASFTLQSNGTNWDII